MRWALASCLIPGWLHAAPVLNPDNGHYYERIDVPAGIDWFAADAAASGMFFRGDRGHLATIASAAENAFIVSELGGPLIETKWLGGFQPDPASPPASGWQWVTGEPWGYTNWSGIEPNDNEGTVEDGLHFKWTRTGAPLGTWNDLPRTLSQGKFETIDGFIVEYSSVPEPSIPLLVVLGAGMLAQAAASRRALPARSGPAFPSRR